MNSIIWSVSIYGCDLIVSARKIPSSDALEQMEGRCPIMEQVPNSAGMEQNQFHLNTCRTEQIDFFAIVSGPQMNFTERVSIIVPGTKMN